MTTSIPPVFTGATGQIFSALSAFYILLIMMLMSIRLYSKQRKKSYIYLLFAFFIIMAYQGLNIHFVLSHTETYPAIYRYVSGILQMTSFILLNFAVYQLYHRMRPKHSVYIVLMFVFMLAIAAVQASFDPALFPERPDRGWMAGLPLNLYHALLLLFFAIMFGPYIRQRLKYALSLAVYSFILIIRFANYYVFDTSHTVLLALENFTPILYYTILFFILFDRIVELLQSIYRSSITDGLTSLFNRRYFYKALNRYVSEGLRVSVIFCDIDNFKKLNDTQGHDRADEVLKKVASIMTEETEGIGIAGRYGGEELVALVVDRRAKIDQVAEAIRSRVEEETIVTVSVGYSVLRKGMSAEQLIKQADEAMYHSKTTGKNKVTSYAQMRRKPKEAAKG